MKFIIALAIASVGLFSKTQAQVNKIEHFFASSPKADKLFHFFSKDLQLPVIWDFKSWGSFASGGVTLGNVAFELVTFAGADTTSFNGIALEPTVHMEEFEKELDKLGVAHDSIDNSNVQTDSAGMLRGWAMLTPKYVLPDEINFFVCDYKERKRIADNRKKGSDKLIEINGGGLGVVSLKEIVVGITDIERYSQQLQKFPSVKKTDYIFLFTDGPALRLEHSSINAIQKIVIKVASLERARSFLESKKLLSKVTGKSVFILPAAIDGLQIELVEQ